MSQIKTPQAFVEKWKCTAQAPALTKKMTAELRLMLAAAVQAERERCAKLVEKELSKLNGRWSLDSAYLSQAIDAIRASGAGGT